MERIRKCQIHTSENITNLCTRDGCFVQLCVACICNHTQLHNRINTKPKYQLIKDAYQTANENLSQLKEQITKEKNRVTALMSGIDKKKKEVKNFLKRARQEAIATVNRTFDEVQENFNRHLEQHKQKAGLLNQTQVDKIYSGLNKQSLDIFNLQQELNTYQYPKLIQILNREIVPKQKIALEQISKELTSNQQFQPFVNYKASNLEEISLVIKRLITTSMIYPVSNSEQLRNCISSRTPMKNSTINIPYPQNKSNITIISSIEKRSPKGNVPLHLTKSTRKQNNWLSSQPQQLKIFFKTHS